MPRVLLIAYEFPPSAGGGVQRVTKFGRFLRDEGWDVHVVAAEPLPGRPRDEGLLGEVEGIPVHRLPSCDITTAIARALSPGKAVLRAARRLLAGPRRAEETARGEEGGARPRPPLSTRLAKWVAMPDEAILWSRSVAPVAARLHAETPFDVVLASGPPYSALLVASRIGRRLRVPVVLDMRDAWSNAYHSDWPTRRKRDRFVALESEALSAAQAVVAVSDAIADEALNAGAHSVHTIPNGFDDSDMPQWTPDPDGPLRLAYMGRLSPGVSDPTVLFSALHRARAMEPDLSGSGIDIIGPDVPWAHELASRLDLSDAVCFTGFKPYREALAAVAAADYGIVLLEHGPASAGVFSGKFFDYLGIGIPVLVLGPESSGAAVVTREGRFGTIVAGDDVESVTHALIDLARRKRGGSRTDAPDPGVRSRYDRREQVRALSGILADVAGVNLQDG
ncbi:MAG: glycosyltransferase [Coriobacteriia bacterium]